MARPGSLAGMARPGLPPVMECITESQIERAVALIAQRSMPMTDDILADAKNHFHAVKDDPWPSNLPLSREWVDRSRDNATNVDIFASVEEAILYAQNLGKSGFNHRGDADKSSIENKLRIFSETFPDMDLRKSQLSDSMLSVPRSLYMWYGRPISTIFFWHVHVALTTLRHFNSSPERIMEIGAGCGELARHLKMLVPDVHYVIIDIPASLFYSEVFLRKHFPDLKFLYVDIENIVQMLPIGQSLAEFDFLLVPVPYMDVIKSSPFDFAINQGSMQEMTDGTVQGYIDFIQSLDIHGFYSLNYQRTPINFGEEWVETSDTSPRLITVDCGVDRERCFKPVSDV